MGIITSTELLPAEEIKHGIDLYPNIFPFNNSLVQEYCMTYQLNAKDINDLYSTFSNMDSSNYGYISIDDLLCSLRETRNSIIFPFLEGLFKLVEKKEKDFIDFFEWITMTMEYSLMNEEQIHKFIFRIIDVNNDELISKRDILLFFSREHNKKKIFPVNYLKQIEVLELDRADSISKSEFKKVLDKVPYLSYPSYRLQEQMKYMLGNKGFWAKVYTKL